MPTTTPKIKYSPCLSLTNGINLDLMTDNFKSEWLELVVNLYPEFIEWMQTTSPINTKMLLFHAQSGETIGQAIYKIKKNNRIKICNFYIAKSYRACSVGKMFLKSLLTLLSINYTNHQAYATVMRSTNSKYFYVNHGFQIVAETDRGEDVVAIDLPIPSDTYSGYGFLPFTLKYFNDFMAIDERLNTFKSWRYFSRIPNIDSFVNNRVLLYVSSPAQAIAGEAVLCQDMLGHGKAREVINKEDRELSKSSFLLKDFIFYPRYLDLTNMKNLGAIDRHPQRLVHLDQSDFNFIHRLAFFG